MADLNIDAYVKKILDVVTGSPERLKEAASSSDALKKILGEDGKLSKDDFERILTALKASAPAKGLLGEDGKLDKGDVERITADAKNAGENLLNKAKGLIK